MLSDESTFRLYRNQIRMVRWPVGERLNPKFCTPTVKHSASVMVWEAFSGNRGRAGIFFLPHNITMNAVRYRQVMEENLLDFMTRQEGRIQTVIDNDVWMTKTLISKTL